MKRKALFATLVVGVILLSAESCEGPKGGDAANRLKNCASTDLVPASQILYTGPVGVGPGSRWVKFREGLVTIAADVSDIFSPPVPPSIYAPHPALSSCTLTTSGKISLDANLGVDVSSLPVSAALKAKIGRETKVSVSAEGFEWDSIKFDVYNNLIASLPESSPYKHPGPNRLTAVSMLKVKGYTATVDISSPKTLGLDASYKGPLPSNLTGDAKANISATIDSSGKLDIKVPGETFIMGIFRPVNGATGQTESAHMKTAETPAVWKVAPASVRGSRRLDAAR